MIGKVHAEGLAIALCLVVAGAGARARDVAAVGLGRGNVLGRRIAVDLAAREEQEASHALAPPPSVLKQRAEPVDVRVHRLDRVLAVVRRRRDGCGVDDVIKIPHPLGQRSRHIVAHQGERGIAAPLLEPRGHAAHEVVVHRHTDRPRPGPLVPVEEEPDEIVAEEKKPPDAAPGNQNATDGK